MWTEPHGQEQPLPSPCPPSLPQPVVLLGAPHAAQAAGSPELRRCLPPLPDRFIALKKRKLRSCTPSPPPPAWGSSSNYHHHHHHHHAAPPAQSWAWTPGTIPPPQQAWPTGPSTMGLPGGLISLEATVVVISSSSSHPFRAGHVFQSWSERTGRDT